MPYIDPAIREAIDRYIEGLANVINDANHNVSGLDGVLNYTICRLLTLLYKDESYFNYNRQVGMLECVKMELYRRRISPYEDTKVEKNGDLPGWK